MYARVSGRLAGSMITAAIVFVAGGILGRDEALGWLGPTIESESVPAAAGLMPLCRTAHPGELVARVERAGTLR